MNTLITETNEHGEEIPIDIFTKLSNDRILFISDYVDDRLATDITATLLLKDCESNEKITLMINTEGGDIRSVFMIFDMMQLLACDIETICVGSCMNEAVLLLAAGTKGQRRATKNAVICVSQLAQEKYYRANLEDAKSVVSRISMDNKNFMGALAKKVGKKTAELLSKFEKKVFMNAKQAKAYDLVDEIIGQ